MTAIHYLDFDLLIEPAAPSAATYRVRVLNSPAGQASAEFELPFSPLELENFLLRVGRTRRGLRWAGSPEMMAAREFGSKLFTAVFQGQVQACLLRSLDLSHQQAQGLRIRLRLANAPGLVDLPWEYLYDTGFGRFFCHSTATPLVRYLDLPHTTRPLAVRPPLKVLVMIAGPRDREQLDVEAEWRKMQDALADLEKRGLVTLTRLPVAKLAALQRQLRREQYHIFHFVGHGGFDQQTQEGVLLLEDETGLSRLVSGNFLGALLHNHRTLRLSILNACEGARTAASDPFAGVAQHLVRQGIPAVIAMQFEITDKAAITLAQEFYAALADGYPVDAALTEARVAIFTQGNDIEWGTPVLYMRSPDGHLFDVAAPPQPAITQQPAPTEPEIRRVADLPAAQHEQPPPALPPDAAHKEQPVFWRRPGLLFAVTAALLLLAVLWQGPRWFNALFSGVDGAPPASTITPETAATQSEQSPTPDQTATVSGGVELPLDLDKPAAPPQAGATLTNAIDGALYVWIPPGEFTMGSGDEDGLADIGEKPAHTVEVDGFWIMQTEVTNAQYQRCVEAGLCTEPGNSRWDDATYAEHPVTHVNWNQASVYAAWAGGRLPTEAEWEKACRGIDAFMYPWGDQAPDDQRLNYNSNVGDTTPVKNYPPGANGLYDMGGNVWEWTADWYDRAYYAQSPVANPEGPESGEGRTLRGGSWGDPNGLVRCAIRGWYDPDDRYDVAGFRVVRHETAKEN